MVLQLQRSAHNAMLGRLGKRPPPADEKAKASPSKRLKVNKKERKGSGSDSESDDHSPAPPVLSPRRKIPQRDTREIPDSEAEDNEALNTRPDEPVQTGLEQALLPIKTDKDAIEEYETLRAAGGVELADLQQRLGERTWTRGKSSIYVDAFNLALETVLDEESHLFDAAENKLFEEWRALPYEAQYLYVRLFLRKTHAWHRIARLGYYGDIADMPGAASELYRFRDLPEPTTESQVTPGELEPPEGATLGSCFTFADNSDDHITTLEEASSLLLLDELKAIAKEAKVQGKNKTELLKALRRTSGKQAGLDFVPLTRSDTQESVRSYASGEREESPSKTNRDTHFVRKIMAETGQCIRLSPAPLKLFERVHLVFYRSTEWTEKSLTTIILARIARRNFPEYIVSRSANIFASRSLLLEFEASLRTQLRIDNILEFSGYPTKEGLQVVLDIFEEVLPRFRALLAEEQQKEDSIYFSGEGSYLRRLSPAWVYTRIVHKAAFVLGTGKFKQHAREHAILSELLDQRLFHASRRGAWYQRKALLEEHYMANLNPSNTRTPEENKKHWKRIALQTCEQGLQDNLVHLIYHYDLQKRITKLEKSLKIAKRFQHDFLHATLAKAVERTFEGIRIERAPPLVPRLRRDSSAVTSKGSGADTPPVLTRRGAKTIWLDPLEGQGECSVESMCLSHYRMLGYKGFHAEGGIVRTLFALLFFDVLFCYVPNVFQTAYQTCPLDLHTEGFVEARMSEVNARLAEIGNGEAERIIRHVWATQGERKTCVIGLDWNFELEDLCEIARCFGGDKLGTLCKVMAEEYAERGGGVPDLFLWRVFNDEETKKNGGAVGEVVFSEVKSENDRLSDTQRLWLHVLMGAGIKVELCHAKANEVKVLD